MDILDVVLDILGQLWGYVRMVKFHFPHRWYLCSFIYIHAYRYLPITTYNLYSYIFLLMCVLHGTRIHKWLYLGAFPCSLFSSLFASRKIPRYDTEESKKQTNIDHAIVFNFQLHD